MANNLQEIHVPDLGSSEAVPVGELFIRSGKKIQKEEPLLSLESDKAVIEIPSPLDGTVREVKVKEGDMLKSGDLICLVSMEEKKEETKEAEETADTGEIPGESTAETEQAEREQTSKDIKPPDKPPSSPGIHASPSIRHFARELGADLNLIQGTGPKGRVRREDVQDFVRKALENPPGSASLPSLPETDPSRFGPVAFEELTRIQKISSSRLHASWVNIPHVTHFDEADITNLEIWRDELNGKGTHGVKFSSLAFMVKALYKAVEEFPRFNAVLDRSSGSLILRKYYNIGIAVDTPQGLLVPVIKNVDTKSLTEIVRDINDLAGKGRNGDLTPGDLEGAGISISNLGGIGGTGFTPIINPPEVAILGMARSRRQPVWQDGEFLPRMILPLSLSYDHRVIDGAMAARFTRYLAELLEDMKKILL